MRASTHICSGESQERPWYHGGPSWAVRPQPPGTLPALEVSEQGTEGADTSRRHLLRTSYRGSLFLSTEKREALLRAEPGFSEPYAVRPCAVGRWTALQTLPAAAEDGSSEPRMVEGAEGGKWATWTV